jgi:hypothetical protein
LFFFLNVNFFHRIFPFGQFLSAAHVEVEAGLEV